MSSKVFITGAGGFIGSHLAEAALQKGHHVKALVRYRSDGSLGFIDHLKDDIEIVSGDIRDFDCISKATKDIDTIFHLAALIGIPYSYVSPMAYIKTNIEGTYNILESAKLHGTQNVLVTSTSETYGSAQFVPINEKHPTVGQSPYSATKISADEIARSYHLSFDIPVKTVRPFNTFGPRQSARAIIPTIISQIQAGKANIHLGSLTPTRDFTFVKDTAAGFLAIADSKKTIGEAVNIGMNKEISIGDLVLLIAELMDKKVTVSSDDQRIRPTKSEVTRLRCDNSKIKKLTNWKPDYTFKQGLLETIEWTKDNFHLFQVDRYNI